MIDMPLLRQAKNIVQLQQSASGGTDSEQTAESKTWNILHNDTVRRICSIYLL